MAPDDIQRHAVKGADLIADAGQQPPFRQKGSDAGGKVQCGGIGKGDDQDLLIRLLISAGLHQFFDEVRGQGRKREGLPAARDGRDPHGAAGVGKDQLLFFAGCEGHQPPPSGPVKGSMPAARSWSSIGGASLTPG